MDSWRRRRADPESGFTLIEVLVTVSLLSIAFVAILGALTVLITSTAQHRRATQAEAVARNAAEYVKSAGVPYVPCASTYDLAAMPNIPAHFAVSVTSVKAWDGNTSPAAYVDTCTTDRGAQLVTLGVDGPQANQTLSVVKRAPG